MRSRRFNREGCSFERGDRSQPICRITDSGRRVKKGGEETRAIRSVPSATTNQAAVGRPGRRRRSAARVRRGCSSGDRRNRKVRSRRRSDRGRRWWSARCKSATRRRLRRPQQAPSLPTSPTLFAPFSLLQSTTTFVAVNSPHGFDVFPEDRPRKDVLRPCRPLRFLLFPSCASHSCAEAGDL